MEYLKNQSMLKYGKINIVHGLDFPNIDLGRKHALCDYFDKSIHYDFVVNCAAITNTTDIEGSSKDKSYLINALAMKWIADACNVHRTKLIHISTDYVFSENTISDYNDNTLQYAYLHS